MINVIISQTKERTDYDFEDTVSLSMDNFEQLQKLIDSITDNNTGAKVSIEATITLPTIKKDGDDE